MSAGLLERPAAPAQTLALRSLAALEARRYARSPLFLIGVSLLVWTTTVATGDLAKNAATADPGDLDLLPAFCLGLLGVFVGHQLTRSLDGADEALGATPSDRVRRTAALCLACLVPGVVALVWVGWMSAALAMWRIPLSASISSGARAAMLLSGAVCAVGGPLFGVLVARWTRFPGSALVAVVVLAGWTLLSPRSAAWVAGGSPGWYLAYLVLLCGLAASAALFPGSTGPRRTRVLRVLGSLAVVAVVCLVLAVLPDPARIPL